MKEYKISCPGSWRIYLLVSVLYIFIRNVKSPTKITDQKLLINNSLTLNSLRHIDM